MTKRQVLYLQRRSRPEQSDQRQPNQAANISHQPRASPNSTALASRIEFPTITGHSLSSAIGLKKGIVQLVGQVIMEVKICRARAQASLKTPGRLGEAREHLRVGQRKLLHTDLAEVRGPADGDHRAKRPCVGDRPLANELDRML
jgi:hypothetical protein